MSSVKKALLALMFISICSISFGQGLGLNSITVKGGVLLPEDPWDTGFTVGAKADIGEVMDGVHLFPVLEYWLSSYDFGAGSLDLTNFQIGAEAHYSLADKVKGLYVGAGIVMNFISVDLPSFSLFGVSTGGGSSSTTDFGATVLAGYKIPVGSMQGVIEAKYNLSDLSDRKSVV